ncbi:MAG: hypothetical protein AB7S26_28515 [Sandaracinaceae bacterium]
MADSDSHDVPGELPQLRDEAADSPLWLPALGLTILLLGAVVIVWRGATSETTDDAAETAEEAAPADEPAPAEEPPAEAAPADPH